MRRTSILITIAALTLTTMALSGGPALAQGQPSCFGEFARAVPGGPGPGEGISSAAQELAQAPGGNPHFAQTLQEIREDLC